MNEWSSPFKSPAFGLITITITLYSFLVYDEIKDSVPGESEGNSQKCAGALWWVGSVPHAITTIIKFGEWVGQAERGTSASVSEARTF